MLTGNSNYLGFLGPPFTNLMQPQVIANTLISNQLTNSATLRPLITTQSNTNQPQIMTPVTSTPTNQSMSAISDDDDSPTVTVSLGYTVAHF